MSGQSEIHHHRHSHNVQMIDECYDDIAAPSELTSIHTLLGRTVRVAVRYDGGDANDSAVLEVYSYTDGFSPLLHQPRPFSSPGPVSPATAALRRAALDKPNRPTLAAMRDVAERLLERGVAVLCAMTVDQRGAVIGELMTHLSHMEISMSQRADGTETTTWLTCEGCEEPLAGWSWENDVEQPDNLAMLVDVALEHECGEPDEYDHTHEHTH